MSQNTSSVPVLEGTGDAPGAGEGTGDMAWVKPSTIGKPCSADGKTSQVSVSGTASWAISGASAISATPAS